MLFHFYIFYLIYIYNNCLNDMPMACQIFFEFANNFIVIIYFPLDFLRNVLVLISIFISGQIKIQITASNLSTIERMFWTDWPLKLINVINTISDHGLLYSLNEQQYKWSNRFIDYKFLWHLSWYCQLNFCSIISNDFMILWLLLCRLYFTIS